MINMLNTLAAGSSDIEGNINSLSIKSVLVASLLLVVLLVIASLVMQNKRHEALKTPLFIAITATIIIPSLLLIGSTVYINTISESGGPVHWHTDIEYWVCGQEIEIRDPYAFLSNKVGTSTYHEHDDKRIHLEGVVIEKEYDASLEKFMDVTGGSITSTSMVIPTNDYYIENDIDGDVPRGDVETLRKFISKDADNRTILSVQNGQTCGSNQPAEVQTFLFRYNDNDDTYTQTKLQDPSEYIMRDESIVPPGDCLVVEFDVTKSSTDRLCQQYGVRDTQRCTEFGVSTFNPELCNIKQIVSPQNPQETPTEDGSESTNEDAEFEADFEASTELEEGEL